MFSVPCPPSGSHHSAQFPMVVTGGAASETDYNYADRYSCDQPNHQRAGETIEMEAARPQRRSSCTLLQLGVGGLVYRGGIACAVGEFVGPEDHQKESGFLVCEPEQAVDVKVSLSKGKVGLRLSPEERKERIHRYVKKRDHRNFAKRIKYTCRKTLADNRPRVRGRFAKHDDQNGKGTKAAIDDDDDDDFHRVVVKEEEMLDWDILAHISGVNSFTFNLTLES